MFIFKFQVFFLFSRLMTQHQQCDWEKLERGKT